MREFLGKRVLITGASSGIGRALAGELAGRKARLLVTARRRERLEALAEELEKAGPRPAIVAGDLTETAMQRTLIDRAETELGGLDLLVNNAGVGATVPFRDTRDELFRDLMEVNFFSAVQLTRLALPLLNRSAAAGDDHPMIVNVGSIVGLRGVPGSGAYSASKFAITGWSESLRAELVRDGIDLLLVSPGTTATEFFESQLEDRQPPHWPRHDPVSPEYVARKIVEGIEKRKHHIVPYRKAKILDWMNRFFPIWVDRLMARYC
jgi:short-subunit dehydrogenase